MLHTLNAGIAHSSTQHCCCCRLRLHHCVSQEALWTRLAESMDVVHDAAVAVWHLQRVLAKKRDPLTHDLFIHIVQGREGSGLDAEAVSNGTDAALLPCQRFW